MPEAGGEHDPDRAESATRGAEIDQPTISAASGSLAETGLNSEAWIWR
jgi:hypothetical protein